MTRFVRVVAAAAALASCDRVFGLDHHAATVDAAAADAALDAMACATPLDADIDGDGLDDGCDPCIAPATDYTADLDSDSIPNASDPCPFDPTPPGAVDTDMDGIPDLCDPSPNAVDHRRCFLAFTNATVSGKLWTAAQQGQPWTVEGGGLEAPATSSGTYVSAVTESIEAPGASTTYVAQFVLDPTGKGGGPAHVAMLVRTGSNDVRGCEASVQADGTCSFGYLEGNTLEDVQSAKSKVPLTSSFGVRITGQIVPTGSDDSVICQLIVAPPGGGSAVSVIGLQAEGTGPDLPGTFGLAADTWDARLLGLEVLTE
jgi:hypothetical protein|nr:hypothetical protein [Kofleriaceae bacterium]